MARSNCARLGGGTGPTSVSSESCWFDSPSNIFGRAFQGAKRASVDAREGQNTLELDKDGIGSVRRGVRGLLPEIASMRRRARSAKSEDP